MEAKLLQFFLQFFKWADEVSKSSSEGQSGVCSGKFHLSTPQEVDVYLKGHQINMYSNCQIVRSEVTSRAVLVVLDALNSKDSIC